MSIFSDIPIRSNADTGLVTAAWWNTIRTALIGAFGTVSVAETQGTLANNMTAYTSISGLSFDHSATRAWSLDYTIYRDDGTTSRREIGVLKGMYKAREGTWAYERQSWGDDSLNMTDSLILNSSGQVQYKSDSFAIGLIRYKSVITFNKES